MDQKKIASLQMDNTPSLLERSVKYVNIYALVEHGSTPSVRSLIPRALTNETGQTHTR